MEKPFDFGEYLLQFIADHHDHPPEGFKPCAYYTPEADTLHVWWEDDRSYCTDLQGYSRDPEGRPYNSMGLEKKIDESNKPTNIPIGVKVYGLRQILKDVGLKIVPIKKAKK